MGFYKDFAYVYDELMETDIDYNRITDFIVKTLAANDITADNNTIIADLACGTGAFTRRLSAKGFDMIGIDISEDMLSVSRETDQISLYLNQDISNFELYGTVSAITCMVDGLNYIINDSDLQHIFNLMYNYLEFNGVAIFDMTSLYKLREIHGNNTFIFENDNLFYCWENYFCDKDDTCEMYLNFFLKKDDLYKRFVEEHIQKGREVHQIGCMLEKSGFVNIEVYANTDKSPIKENSERIYFVVKKRSE